MFTDSLRQTRIGFGSRGLTESCIARSYEIPLDKESKNNSISII
jgi:hypothetical protein